MILDAFCMEPPRSFENEPMDETVRLLDAAVHEVFGLMIGLECVALGPVSSFGGGLKSVEACLPSQMTAIVGFAGAMTGTCILRVSQAGARRMIGSMLGTVFAQVDATVVDGLGEVCNMVAGGWKSRVPSLAAGCLLSIPTVILGEAQSLHLEMNGTRVEREYLFEQHRARLTLLCDLIC